MARTKLSNSRVHAGSFFDMPATLLIMVQLPAIALLHSERATEHNPLNPAGCLSSSPLKREQLPRLIDLLRLLRIPSTTIPIALTNCLSIGR